MAAAGFRRRSAALALLAAAGCTSIAVGARTFEGTRWHVTAINGHPTPRGGNFEVRFENGRIAGQFGCNRFSGPYAVAGETITTGPIAATRMACASATDEPAVSPMDYENWGFAVVSQPMRWTWIAGTKLTLGNSAGSIQLERAP